MSHKVSPETLKNYSEEFCATVLRQAYAYKQVLNGQDLLNLTPIKQINQNIVSRLSVYWNSQIQGFKSPYFDFSNPKIQEAIKQFSAAVSQHITLQQEHLKPWLQEAVDKALLPFEDVTSLTPELELRLNQFSQILPLVLFNEEETAVEEQQEFAESSFSFFDFAETTSTAATETIAQEQVIEPMRDIVQESPDKHINEVIESTPETSLPTVTEPIQYTSTKRIEFNALAGEMLYSNVNFRIDSIANNIPLNLRFMFISQLFNGDFNAFKDVVELLDNAGSFDSVKKLIEEQIIPQYNWDINSDAAKEILSLVKRRYA